MSGRMISPNLFYVRPDPVWVFPATESVRLIPGGASPEVFTMRQYPYRGNGVDRTPGTISGTVTISGVGGVSRRVLLFDRLTGKHLDETWSAADGSYSFEHYDSGREYLVVAIDHTKTYNAARADAVVPE